jgi:hypothetical protein
MYKLGPCCGSVVVTVANNIAADPAVEAVSLAVTELTAAPILRLLNKFLLVRWW